MSERDLTGGLRTACRVCFRQCDLAEGQTGACGARKNDNGKVLPVNYGVVTTLALDPIEKKPLAMFRPGSRILSVGSYGCNLFCPYCQNHEISRMTEKNCEGQTVLPETLVETALSLRDRGNIGIAYTYNEPLVGWEFVYDTARIAADKGLVNVLVTNGSVSLPVLETILPYMNAMNIDLKGFSEEYYRWIGGDFETSKAFIRRAVRDCHVEVTTLIVPGKNDSEEEMDSLSRWLASLDPEIPLHVTRYFPRYRMREPATDVKRVYRLAGTARKYLKHVFVGNC